MRKGGRSQQRKAGLHVIERCKQCVCAVSCRGSDIVRDEVIGKGSSAEVYKVVTASGVTLAVKRCVCNFDLDNIKG